MRLSEKEIQNLKDVFNHLLKNISYQIFLFGSRVDNQKKGGDIDILLKVQGGDYQKVRELKSLLKFDLEAAAGDQRVDLTITTPELLHSDPFLNSIRDELVEIRAGRL